MKHVFASIVVCLALVLQIPSLLVAQDSITRKQKAFLDMQYISEDGQGKVHFKLYTREGDKKKPVQFSIVNLFLSEETKWGMMGNITTDSNGEGIVPLHDRFEMSSKNMPEYHLLGSMKDDPRLQETQTKLTIKPSTLELQLYQQDSMKFAKVTLKEEDTSGAWVAAPREKIDFYVEKYFTLLPSVVTDENGEALLEIPMWLKGDKDGNIKIVARINDSDKYGIITSSSEKKWGVPDETLGWLDRSMVITGIVAILAIIIYAFSWLLKRRFN